MKRIVLDQGFAPRTAMLLRAQAGAPSVILIRLEGLDSAGQASLIRSVWAVCEEAISDGAAVSVDAASIRVRKLPLR